jgi:hypothetical protein
MLLTYKYVRCCENDKLTSYNPDYPQSIVTMKLLSIYNVYLLVLTCLFGSFLLHFRVYFQMKSSLLQAHSEIDQLKRSFADSNKAISSTPLVSTGKARETHFVPVNPYDICETRFGLSLVDKWKESKQTWCSDKESTASSDTLSSLTCYPYLQWHKQKSNKKADIFW